MTKDRADHQPASARQHPSIATSGYHLEVAIPSSEDYRRLRVAAGLSPKTAEGAALGLPNTLFGVSIEREGKIVGMGRVIGDGGLFFQVTDIAVDPHHQGRGLGKAIVHEIVEHLKRTAPTGAYVSLIADGEAHRLYARFGFRPTAPASIGMEMYIDPLSQ
jgi:ribosomal protein S18 acetylase RimI-like enzyme